MLPSIRTRNEEAAVDYSVARSLRELVQHLDFTAHHQHSGAKRIAIESRI